MAKKQVAGYLTQKDLGTHKNKTGQNSDHTIVDEYLVGYREANKL